MPAHVLRAESAELFGNSERAVAELVAALGPSEVPRSGRSLAVHPISDGIQLTRVPKALAGDDPHIPCSDDVRRHRSAGRSDPRRLRAARRILGCRRVAPAVPWHRQCSGARVRADNRRLAAAAQAATRGETAPSKSQLTATHLTTHFGCAPSLSCAGSYESPRRLLDLD